MVIDLICAGECSFGEVDAGEAVAETEAETDGAEAEAERLAARLASLSYVCTVFPSDANFLLVRLKQHEKAKLYDEACCAKLVELGLA